MSIKRLRRDWDALGREDPLWAICSDPAKRGGGWDPAGFFAYGREEIQNVLGIVRELHPTLATKRALDFGCGVGRLTQALAAHFEEVTGVDIAPSMIEQAEEHASAAGLTNCTFVLNERDDLSMFADESFDFVYSRIVLQHIPPPFAEHYISELVRIVGRDGLAIFQVPSRAPRSRRALFYLRQRLKSTVALEAKSQLYPVPVDRVQDLVEAAGGTVIDCSHDDSVPRWESFRYCVYGGPCRRSSPPLGRPTLPAVDDHEPARETSARRRSR